MAQYQEGPVEYGELTVLGHNGDEARMRRHFALRQRPRANGVKPSAIHMGGNQAISAGDQHSVSYFVSTVSTIAVEYAPDTNTDMFQIGRSTKSPIDFVVTDTVPLSDSPSAIPRFGCRIVCQRSPPHSTRIYAAGFDLKNDIFLGENAVKWRSCDGQMDALTTNGVLVAHPVPLHGLPQSYLPGLWREISVCGNVFSLRETHTPQQRGNRVDGESQELVDGSLIDLGGVTLLWRSAEGLAARSPPAEHLEVQRQEIYAGRPCFVYKMIKLQPPSPSPPPPPPPPHPPALGLLPEVALGTPLPASFLEQIRKGVVLKILTREPGSAGHRGPPLQIREGVVLKNVKRGPPLKPPPPPPRVISKAMLEKIRLQIELKNVKGSPPPPPPAAPMHDAPRPPTPRVSGGGGPPPPPSNVGVAHPPALGLLPELALGTPLPASFLEQTRKGVCHKEKPRVSGGGGPPPPPPPSNARS